MTEQPPSGQPQPSQWQRDEQESRDALARGEGITFENAEQAIKWLQEPELGQPQQEPARVLSWDMLDEMHGLAHPECHGECEVREALRHRGQERQAGGHVHKFGPPRLAAEGAGGAFRQCDCGYFDSIAFADGYERGVADAAAAKQ